ncbi:hypothetical protein C4D60_Mb09t19530 [Musa balbisiana]|uniref:Uncharacterized protein n=1 Tax=Musa balbisiana TaxID=52838 RepID=A0A4S8IHK0_MUSBA|nr:hypothetical protein C4D60_Mb09t19530 [Musa balbisiana]
MRNSIGNPWCSSFMGADIAMISMCLKSPAVLTKLPLAPSQIPSQGLPLPLPLPSSSSLPLRPLSPVLEAYRFFCSQELKEVSSRSVFCGDRSLWNVFTYRISFRDT